MMEKINYKKYDLVIIIPCYNEEEFLGLAIESVIKARNKSSLKISIIISDNCSKDGSLSIAQKFMESFEDIRIIKNSKNIGARANLLNSLKRVDARYFMFLDAHDFISNEYFLEVEKVLAANYSQDVVLMPNEFKVAEDSCSAPINSKFKYKFHVNSKIRFWQLVFYLHNSTEIHSIFPLHKTELDSISSTRSIAFDHLFMHFYFTKYNSVYLNSPYYRRYKKNLGPHDAYLNSYGEIENREQRVIGDSGYKVSNEFLGSEIIEAAGTSISRIYYPVIRLLLFGKYNPKSFSFYLYRASKMLFTLFSYCARIRK